MTSQIAVETPAQKPKEPPSYILIEVELDTATSSEKWKPVKYTTYHDATRLLTAFEARVLDLGLFGVKENAAKGQFGEGEVALKRSVVFWNSGNDQRRKHGKGMYLVEAERGDVCDEEKDTSSVGMRKDTASKLDDEDLGFGVMPLHSSRN